MALGGIKSRREKPYYYTRLIILLFRIFSMNEILQLNVERGKHTVGEDSHLVNTFLGKN